MRSLISGFSALQRAEIAETAAAAEGVNVFTSCFSALQRAEIAETEGSGRCA